MPFRSLIERISGLRIPAGPPDEINGPPPVEGAICWDGKGRGPLTMAEYYDPITDPSMRRETARNRPPFPDLISPRAELKDGLILLRDLRNCGLIWNVTPVGTEARTDEFMEDLHDKLHHAIKEAVPENPRHPWILQCTMEDETGMAALKRSIREYIDPEILATPYTQDWLKVLEQHLDDVGRPGGLFDDPITGGRWRGRNRRIRLMLWRLVPPGKRMEGESLPQVGERLENAFAQAGVKLDRVGGDHLYRWLSAWFCPDPEPYMGVNLEQLLEQHPWPSKGSLLHHLPLLPDGGGADFGIATLHGMRPWSFSQDGTWWFTNRPHRFLSLDEPTDEPDIGHLSAERVSGDHRFALWDRMPEDSIWSMSIVYGTQEQIKEHIKKIENASIGDDPDAENSRAMCYEALQEIADGNPIYRTYAGVFLRGKDLRDLDRKSGQAIALLGAHRLRMVKPHQDPIALDCYIRALPFGFDPQADRRWFRRRARSWYASHLAALLPVYGRSTGTGNPGSIRWTRGAEPFTFDPLNRQDRRKNAHLFLFGPTGSGKTAWLIDQLLHTMAVHRPKLVLITSLPTFELLGQHFESLGLTVNYVNLSPESDASLPPFADALKALEAEETGNPHTTDHLGQMEVGAQIMITGGIQDELRKIGRDGLTLIRDAILEAARAARNNGNDQVLTEDVAQAMNTMATNDDRHAVHGELLARMSASLRMYCTGFSGRLFNRPGELWPDVDVTIVNTGTLARKGYESQLAVALTGMMNRIHDRLEKEQYDGRHTITVIDEAHVQLKNELIGPYINSYIATWRTLGGWLWIATQNLNQIPESAKELLNQPEWWVCLSMDKEQAGQIERFRRLTEEQRKLLTAARKEPGRYTEGVVMSTTIMALFRNVVPALSLALSQTEPEEKAHRAKLMQERGCSELEVAYAIAEDIRAQRTQQPT
jgi:conjugative transfer ATPase